MRILVVEDEMDLNDIIVKRLAAEGYGADACYDGAAALDYIGSTEYDAVILDIMLPQVDGLTIVRKMRQSGNTTPVLFLTARDSVAQRVEGLDSGANDYLVKPFVFDELLARIRVLTREKYGTVSNIITVADLTIDCSRRTAERAGQPINLTAKEFALLEYLAKNQEIVLSREQIENHIWGYSYEGGSNAVDVYIRYLRRKIDDGYDQKLIQTIRGSGYVLRDC